MEETRECNAIRVGFTPYLCFVQHLLEALQGGELTQLLHQLHWVQVHPLDVGNAPAAHKTDKESNNSPIGTCPMKPPLTIHPERSPNPLL